MQGRFWVLSLAIRHVAADVSFTSLANTSVHTISSIRSSISTFKRSVIDVQQLLPALVAGSTPLLRMVANISFLKDGTLAIDEILPIFCEDGAQKQ